MFAGSKILSKNEIRNLLPSIPSSNMTHRYPTRYRTAHTVEAPRSESTEKRAENKKQKRAEKEQKRAKEQKRSEKEQKRAEKEAAETLVQMASQEKRKESKEYPENYCDACWHEGEVVSVPNCRDECCTMNVCAYGCTFTCFMCEDSWRGTWNDRNDWFWAGYNDETFPVCTTCMPMVSGMPVSRSAAGLFPWTGLWPGVWLGCPVDC